MIKKALIVLFIAIAAVVIARAIEPWAFWWIVHNE